MGSGLKVMTELLNCLSTTTVSFSQPQNYHPNPCFMEEEEDLDIEQEGCDIKEDDEYIE